MKGIRGRFILLALIVQFGAGFSCSSTTRTFTMIVNDICPSYNPRDNLLDRCWPIINQFHEPLFFDGSNGISSRILNKWEANANFTKFSFCLKETHYSDRTPLLVEDLIANFHNFEKHTILTKHIKKIKKVGPQCLELEFADPNSGLINSLSSLQSAIIKPNSFESRFPTGVSAYRLVTSNERTVVGEYVGSGHPYFTKFVVSLVSALEPLRSIHDVQEANFLNMDFFDRIDKTGYTKYQKFYPNVSSLFFNIKNDSIRKTLFSCIDRNAMVEIFKPIYGGARVEGSDSVIPRGVLGARKEGITQDCVKLSNASGVALVYLNIYPTVEKGLVEYFDGFFRKTGIKISVVTKEKKEIFDPQSPYSIIGPHKKYDIVFLGETGVDPYGYVADFLSDQPSNSLINCGPADLRKRFQEFRTSSYPYEQKNAMLQDFNKVILSRHLSLPLLSVKKEFYYPSNLAGLESSLTSQWVGFYKIEDLTVE